MQQAWTAETHEHNITLMGETRLEGSHINAKTRLEVSHINAKTRLEVSHINAKTRLEVSHINAKTRLEVSHINGRDPIRRKPQACIWWLGLCREGKPIGSPSSPPGAEPQGNRILAGGKGKDSERNEKMAPQVKPAVLVITHEGMEPDPASWLCAAPEELTWAWQM
jgi:hypothetical protein